MISVKKISWIVLSAILGGTFVFSGFSKLFPVELFEYLFVDIGMLKWSLAPYAARIMVAMEFGLGLLLLLSFYGPRKIVLYLTLIILFIFCIFLLFQLWKEGNEGNCGCFGNMVKMTPLESLVKNLILMIFALLLLKFHDSFPFGSANKAIWLCALSFFPITFLIRPVGQESGPNMAGKPYQLELSALYKKENPPSVSLTKGKWIIAFVSLTCSHCKVGAYKLHLLKRANPNFPIYLIMNGSEKNKKAFMEESKSADLPYSMMSAKEGFVENAGFNADGSFTLPSVLFTEDGKVIKRVNPLNLTEQEISNWLGSSEKQARPEI